jgi:hypothetical protein
MSLRRTELSLDLNRDGATFCMVRRDARFAKHAQRKVHPFDRKTVLETSCRKLTALA